MRITDITIHHSETPANTTLESMAKYHVRQHQWPAIAYHYAITQEGKIFQMNSLTDITFHNGFNNSVAVGIVFVGSFMKKDTLTVDMLESLKVVVEDIKLQCSNLKYLMGHREYKGDHTDCPGTNIIRYLDQLRKEHKLSYNNKGNWKVEK